MFLFSNFVFLSFFVPLLTTPYLHTFVPFADSLFRNSYIRIPEAETRKMRDLIFLVTLQGIFVIS